MRMRKRDVDICKEFTNEHRNVAEVWQQYRRLRYSPHIWTKQDFITHWEFSKDHPYNKDHRLPTNWLRYAYAAAVREGSTASEFNQEAQISSSVMPLQVKDFFGRKKQDTLYLEDSQEQDL